MFGELAVCVGLPILAIAVILRLSEGGWGKRRRELGSTGAFAWGIALNLPLACHLASHALS